MQRIIRLNSGIPRSRNGSYIRGVRDTEMRGRLNDGVVIPSQESPEQIEIYNPVNRGQPDIRELDRALRGARGLPNTDPDLEHRERRIQHPGSIRLVNYSSTTLGTLPTLGGHLRYKMRQVLPVRPDRKRFILCNPDVGSGGGGVTMFFSYTNNNALFPIYSGQIIDESGSEISSDDIWIGGPNNGDPFLVLEGRLTGDYT